MTTPNDPVTDVAKPGSVRSVPERIGAVYDFDFLAGAWTIENRPLKVDSGGNETWDEYASTSRMTIFLDHVLNVEEYQFPTKGYAACALRIFDLKKRKWAIYWIESRAGVLLPPVFGGFDGDRGEFYGEEELAGEPVIFRFEWTRIDADRARWEQAYSRDANIWKVNWVMEYTRIAGPGDGSLSAPERSARA